MADNPSFSTLNTKQKVIGVLTLVIIAFIIYEVIGLFSGSKPPAETTITPTPVQPAKPAAAGTSAPGARAVAAVPQASDSNMLPTVNAITSPKHPLDAKEEQQQQQVYLDSVNQLQLLKVKRDIAETNQAIATARLATETANKSMSDLLTQPAVLPQAPISASVYGNRLAGNVDISMQAPPAAKDAPAAVTVKVAPIAEVQFVVISVSMQFNRWSAVLGAQGKMYSVSIGDTLFDGSTVASINKSGVVLVKDGKRRKVNLLATI